MERIGREESGRRLVKGSGFSLDPDYDFSGLAGMLEKFVAEVEGFQSGRGGSAVTPAELAAVVAALKKDDCGPYDAMVDRLEAEGGTLSRTLAELFDSVRDTARAGDRADAGAAGKVLTGLASDLDGLRDGRWPDGSGADFAAIRRALDGGDEAPLRAWLDQSRNAPGVLARAAYDVLAKADHLYHGAEIVDRAGLDLWLRSIKSEAEAWSKGIGPAAEAREAREALARGDDAHFRAMVRRWSEGQGPLGRALGELIAAWGEGAGSPGKPDHRRTIRLLARVERGMKALTTGEGQPLTIASLSTAADKGELGLLIAPDDWPRQGDSSVRSWVGRRLARDSTRFRACDRPALSSYLAETAAWAKKAADDDKSLLSGRFLRMAAAKPEPVALLFLRQQAHTSGNPIAVAVGERLIAMIDQSKRANLGALATAMERYTSQIASLSSDLTLSELRAASRSLSRELQATQGRGKDADLAVVPLLKWTRQVETSANEVAQVVANAVDRESHRYRFQMARYDGDLKGTEVGMVLFYTDLLAKLWAIDFLHNQPARAVEDFHPMTDLQVSPVFEDEIRRLPSTRLWFGPEDKGFQVADEGATLILARNATRIYAASSDPLAPGKEQAAAANSEAFLGWWNDHYPEVARFEPEYERLNQVMKWSLLISWLNERGRGDALGSLAGVDVDRSNWFPDWARKQPGLKFHHWEKIAFHGPGYKGTTTESMPILSSDPYPSFGRVKVLSGGVSLAPKELFKARAALSGEVNPLLRRSDVLYKSHALTGEGLTFQTLQESRFSFKTPAVGRSLLESTPKAGTKLRGRVSEINAPRFERTVSRQSGGLEVATRVADHDLAVLSVRPTKNGLRVGLRGRELAQGQSLAARASTGVDPLASVARHPGVETAIHTPDGLFVQTRGGRNWIKLTGEVTPAKAPSVARVADSKPGARPYDVDFVGEVRLKPAPSGGEDLVVRVSRRPSEATSMNVSARGPPPGGPTIPVEIEAGGATLRGRLDPKAGTMTFALEDVPAEFLGDPARLGGILKRSGLAKLDAKTGPTTPIRMVVKEVSAEESAFIRDLGKDRFGPAAKELADDPAGFARKARAEYTKSLGQCDELLDIGSHDRALAILDGLEEVYGTRPEVRFRQALCDIEGGRTARGARLGNEAMESSRGGLTKFHEEVNARLASRDLTVAARSDIATFRDGAAWRDLQGSGRLPEGKVNLVPDGERLGLDFHASQPLPKGEPVPLDKVLASDAPVYLMDAPGLNNLDWSAGFRRTLESQVRGKLATVVSIPDVGIAEFRPAQVFAGEAGTKAATYTRVRSGGGTPGTPRPTPYRALQSGRGGQGGQDDDDEEERLRAMIEAEMKWKAHLDALHSGREKAAGEVYAIVPAGAP